MLVAVAVVAVVILFVLMVFTPGSDLGSIAQETRRCQSAVSQTMRSFEYRRIGVKDMGAYGNEYRGRRVGTVAGEK